MPSTRFRFASLLLPLLVIALVAVQPIAAAATATTAGAPEETSAVADGIADLRHLPASDERRIVPLHGQWDFYWLQLLDPESLAARARTPIAVQVPASWRNIDDLAASAAPAVPSSDAASQPAPSSDAPSQPARSSAAASLPASSSVTADTSPSATAAPLPAAASVQRGQGYGTYRLLLRIPERDVNGNKALFLRSIGSAYRIWIDGQEREGLGTVGTNRADERPQSHIQMVFFQPRSASIEIVIQVSNFSFREGGIMGEIDYGDAGALIPYILKELLAEIGLIGGFALIGLYHLLVFSLRRKDTATLLVGLLSLTVALRSLFINGYLSSLLAGLNDWERLVKLEYTSELAAFVCGILLMRSLYPQESSRLMLRLGLGLAAAMQLYVLLTPARVFTETMLLQTALKSAVLLYFIVYVGLKAYWRRREGGMIHLVAMAAVVAALLNDMLYYLRDLRTVPLFSYSVAVFILSQAFLVSYRYTRLSQRNDQLVAELASSNASLEEKVAERTRSLHDAQELRTKMLVNIAHDLGTPIVGIQTYIQLLAEGKARLDHGGMTKRLLEKTGYVKRLVHDLFELSKLESKELVLNGEETDAQTWLEETYRLLAADLRERGFELRASWTRDEPWGIVRIDRMRMLQALNNYIDNAVKFSRGMSREIVLGGYIERADEPAGSARLVIEVADFGIGIPAAEQTHVFRRFYRRRERNEEGSGLGLAIVQEIVELHGGEVGVRSREGEGCVFCIKLPLRLQA